MARNAEFKAGTLFLKSYKRPLGMREATNDEKLYMYARFKQATVGDCPNISRPNSFPMSFNAFKENAMW